MKPLLTLKIDLVFKILFARNVEILADLINAVLSPPKNRKIRSVEVKNPVVYPEEISKKYIVLDIRAQDESNYRFDIEMQVRKYASYSKRSLYYLCKLYADQLDSGEDYAELKPVIGIHFLDYEEFPDCPEFHYRFAFNDLRDPEIRLADDIMLHMIELPAFEKMGANRVDKAFAEWVRFFNNADRETEETMREQYTNPNIRKAFDALKTLSEDEETRLRAEIREKALKNEVSELNAARREGMREGVREGMREGMRALIFETLELRFDCVPESVKDMVTAVVDPEILKSMQRIAVTADSIEEFEKYVDSL